MYFAWSGFAPGVSDEANAVADAKSATRRIRVLGLDIEGSYVRSDGCLPRYFTM
jgi:hypothetical protein